MFELFFAFGKKKKKRENKWNLTTFLSKKKNLFKKKKF